MKQMLLVMILLTGMVLANGQTLSEWTRQKKKQLQYLEQQVGALEAGIRLLANGYDLVHKGLMTIGASSLEEFSMHDDYFSRLSSVSTEVKKYGRASDLLRLKDKVFAIGNFLTEVSADNENLSADEVNYITKVIGRWQDGAGSILAEWEAVITPGVYVMKDWERISTIHSLYDQMKTSYVLALHFSNQVRMLLLQRSQLHQDATLEKLWWNIQ